MVQTIPIEEMTLPPITFSDLASSYLGWFKGEFARSFIEKCQELRHETATIAKL